MNGASVTPEIQSKTADAQGERSLSSHRCDPATWVDQYGDSLFRYALSWVRDNQIAEDLVQETFLAALRSQANFSGESTERTWLFGVLKHKIIDHYRAAKRQSSVCKLADARNDDACQGEELENGGESVPAESPIDQWRINPGICSQQKAFWDVLQQCLSKLSPRLSAAFALKEIEQLDTREICAALNVSEGNLWVMLHRARTCLRQCLEINWLNKPV
jgi:RNA polymerase sigma-70 factor, ECF subfamily